MPADQSAQPGSAATAWPAGRPPFRADHVGSLLRPPELLRARDEFAAGRLSADRLRETEDAAIREVVRRQQGNDLTQQQQWDKLRLVVETAQVWGTW
jgi:methionine synthase II (cobalamin-independent)